MAPSISIPVADFDNPRRRYSSPSSAASEGGSVSADESPTATGGGSEGSLPPAIIVDDAGAGARAAGSPLQRHGHFLDIMGSGSDVCRYSSDEEARSPLADVSNTSLCSPSGASLPGSGRPTPRLAHSVGSLCTISESEPERKDDSFEFLPPTAMPWKSVDASRRNNGAKLYDHVGLQQSLNPTPSSGMQHTGEVDATSAVPQLCKSSSPETAANGKFAGTATDRIHETPNTQIASSPCAPRSLAHKDDGGICPDSKSGHSLPEPTHPASTAATQRMGAASSAMPDQHTKGNGAVSKSLMEFNRYLPRVKLASSPSMLADRLSVKRAIPMREELNDRIQSLGTAMPGPQKAMLWIGIVLDIASKISLLREIVRFAGYNIGWLLIVLVFLVTASILRTNYWLVHYPVGNPLPTNGSGREPSVYGFTKHDVRRLVRVTGAILSFIHLGTVFAAWRSLRSQEVKQRRVAMDLKGMRLVDSIFLTLSLAVLQSYIGITCSVKGSECPGREGFDFFLMASIICSLTSGALCFLALDLNDIRVKEDSAYFRGAILFFLFRLCELSCRALLLALFAARFGAWVFAIFSGHALLVLISLRYMPANPYVWAKFTTTIRCRIPLCCGRRIPFLIPRGDDMKLIIACLMWPPSCYVSDATDSEGRFWWRGNYRVGRCFFWSLTPSNSILSFPVFQTIVAVEAGIMIGLLFMFDSFELALYLKVVVTLMVLWCFFGMLWTSAVHGLAISPSFTSMARLQQPMPATPARSPNPAESLLGDCRQSNTSATPSPPYATTQGETPNRGAAFSGADASVDVAVIAHTHRVELSGHAGGCQTVPPGFTISTATWEAMQAMAKPSDKSPQRMPGLRLKRMYRSKGSRSGKENNPAMMPGSNGVDEGVEFAFDEAKPVATESSMAAAVVTTADNYSFACHQGQGPVSACVEHKAGTPSALPATGPRPASVTFVPERRRRRR